MIERLLIKIYDWLNNISQIDNINNNINKDFEIFIFIKIQVKLFKNHSYHIVKDVESNLIKKKILIVSVKKFKAQQKLFAIKKTIFEIFIHLKWKNFN